MNWRTLLEKIGALDPPPPGDLTPLVREATGRDGQVDRRAFLKLAGATFAAVSVDLEKVLWVPGAHASNLSIPSREIVIAKTIEEALCLGLTAYFPDGTRHDIRIGRTSPRGESVEIQLQQRISQIQRLGGRVIQRHEWRRAVSGPDDLRTTNIEVVTAPGQRPLTGSYVRVS